MKLVFVRHADPDYEKDSLTPTGFAEADALVPRLEALAPDEIFCSTMGRAEDTVAPYLKKSGKTAVACDWLREFPGNIKDPETGKERIPWDLLPDYWTRFPELYSPAAWIKTPLMQSGTTPQVYAAVTAELDKLLAAHGYVRQGKLYRVANANCKTLLFVCHFGIQCVLLSHLLGLSPLVLWQGFVAVPSAVTTLITEERQQGIGYFRCNGFGDTAHLYTAGKTPSFAARFCETFDSKERH